MSEQPVNGRVETIERTATAPTPGGRDWTREYGQSGQMLNEVPDEQQMTMIFAAAFGRAKGQLIEALACSDPLVRDQRLDQLILTLVRLAFAEPDAKTILDSLV